MILINGVGLFAFSNQQIKQKKGTKDSCFRLDQNKNIQRKKNWREWRGVIEFRPNMKYNHKCN